MKFTGLTENFVEAELVALELEQDGDKPGYIAYFVNNFYCQKRVSAAFSLLQNQCRGTIFMKTAIDAHICILNAHATLAIKIHIFYLHAL